MTTLELIHYIATAPVMNVYVITDNDDMTQQQAIAYLCIHGSQKEAWRTMVSQSNMYIY
jgi:hypothetical protein